MNRRRFGAILVFVACLVLGYAFTMSVSVGGSVVNLDLMQTRQNLVILGCAVLVVGAALLIVPAAKVDHEAPPIVPKHVKQSLDGAKTRLSSKPRSDWIRYLAIAAFPIGMAIIHVNTGPEGLLSLDALGLVLILGSAYVAGRGVWLWLVPYMVATDVHYFASGFATVEGVAIDAVLIAIPLIVCRKLLKAKFQSFRSRSSAE